MKTSAYLPVGTREDKSNVWIKQGDVLQLVDGDKLTFVEMKRTKWVGKTDNGQMVNVPVYRNKHQFVPYILKVVGHDEDAVVKGVDPNTLDKGDLFTIQGHKETFMFLNIGVKGRRSVVWGIDLATKKKFNIDINMTLVEVNLGEIEEEFCR